MQIDTEWCHVSCPSVVYGQTLFHKIPFLSLVSTATTLFAFPIAKEKKAKVLLFKETKIILLIETDISSIKIVAFMKTFEMLCQFLFIFQYVFNSEPTIFNLLF